MYTPAIVGVLDHHGFRVHNFSGSVNQADAPPLLRLNLSGPLLSIASIDVVMHLFNPDVLTFPLRTSASSQAVMRRWSSGSIIYSAGKQTVFLI